MEFTKPIINQTVNEELSSTIMLLIIAMLGKNGWTLTGSDFCS